jgi:hypothetical protein
MRAPRLFASQRWLPVSAAAETLKLVPQAARERTDRSALPTEPPSRIRYRTQEVAGSSPASSTRTTLGVSGRPCVSSDLGSPAAALRVPGPGGMIGGFPTRWRGVEPASQRRREHRVWSDPHDPANRDLGGMYKIAQLRDAPKVPNCGKNSKTSMQPGVRRGWGWVLPRHGQVCIACHPDQNSPTDQDSSTVTGSKRLLLARPLGSGHAQWHRSSVPCAPLSY